MIRKTLCVMAASLALYAGSTAALAQGTAITYQGQLRNAGNTVNSPTDMQFQLFTAASGGTQVGPTVTVNAVAVSQGLFTAPIDFGVNPYAAFNQTYFLQIAVRNPAGSGSFVPMGARQAITPAPFSLATRGITVDAAGNISLPRDANRTLNVAQEPANVPGGSNGKSLTIAAGSAATGASFASLGGNLILQAGSSFNGSQPNLPGGDTIIRSGANALSADDGRNGGAIILQSGAQNNTFVERMRVTPTGNVGVGVAGPARKLEVAGGMVVDALGTNPGSPGFGTLHESGLRFGGPDSGTGIASTRTPGFPDQNVNGLDFYTSNYPWVSVTEFGAVGLDTREPQSKFHVVGDGFQNNSFSPYGIFETAADASAAGNQFGPQIRLKHGGPGGQEWFMVSSGSANGPAGSFQVVRQGAPGAALYIGSAGAGDIGIGTTAPAARLHNVGTTRLDDTVQFGTQTFTGTAGTSLNLTRQFVNTNESDLRLNLNSPTAGGAYSSFGIWNNGITQFEFRNNGSAFKAGGGSWSVLSDERTKSDVQLLSGTLDRLLKLKGHSYTYKPEYVESGKALPGTQIGLVAQEVEAVFPDWVTIGRDGMKTVTERSTTALMVEAMRDLRNEKDAEINELKARLEKLEAMITAQNSAK